MSDRAAEIRSTSDDVEVRAMLAIVRYLSPLTTAQSRRVLEWARDRYVSTNTDPLPPDWMESFSQGLIEAARKVGAVTPLDLLTFAERVYAERVPALPEPPSS